MPSLLTFFKTLSIAVFGILIPSFLFQEGIARSAPMLVAYIHSTIPIFVMLIQFFDPRLSVSPYSIVGVVTISSLSLISILAKQNPQIFKRISL